MNRDDFLRAMSQSPRHPNRSDWEIERNRAVAAFIRFDIRIRRYDVIFGTINRRRREAGAPDHFMELRPYPIPDFSMASFVHTAMSVRQLHLEDSMVNIQRILGIVASFDREHAAAMKRNLRWMQEMPSNCGFGTPNGSGCEMYTLRELFDLYLYAEGLGIAHFSRTGNSSVLPGRQSEALAAHVLSRYDDPDARRRVVIFMYNMIRLALEASEALVNAIEVTRSYKGSLFIERDRATRQITDARESHSGFR